MPDKEIFCTVPWYEIHIYWDGSLGICCSEDHKIYPQSQRYNIADTTIKDWFNSDPVRRFRLAILGNQSLSACVRCRANEQAGGNSRRMAANLKSAIFTRQAFDQSYLQSPGQRHFNHSQINQGKTDLLPIELHVDLGNYCNLACKMCHAAASTTIASQQVKWGMESSRQYLGQDWTRDTKVWHRFLQQVSSIPNLKNIHFMGGETLLTDRLEQLVDHFIQHNRLDCGLSFVTNGTQYQPRLMEKLSKFQQVGIEISMETMTAHNAYIRQGTDHDQVLANIDRFCAWSSRANMSVTLRPTVSLLSIGHFDTLLAFALERGLVVKGFVCADPAFLQPRILPDAVKQIYITRLQSWQQKIACPASAKDYNTSDPNNLPQILATQTDMALGLLQQDRPDGADDLLAQMVWHANRWDRVYELDARALYPELHDIFTRYGYHV